MSFEDDEEAEGTTATADPREDTTEVRSGRDPHYAVVLDDGECLRVVAKDLPASSRKVARTTARAFLPEEESYGRWGTVLWHQIEWETVEDPLAPAVDAMVAQRVEEDGAEDTPELRMRTRARLKAAQDRAH
jgi:hypothetical protein